MITRILLLGLLLVSAFISHASAQSRDHLTPQEVDLVKEAQVLDKRIEVFIKAAERRLMVINGSAAGNANCFVGNCTPSGASASSILRAKQEPTVKTDKSRSKFSSNAGRWIGKTNPFCSLTSSQPGYRLPAF